MNLVEGIVDNFFDKVMNINNLLEEKKKVKTNKKPKQKPKQVIPVKEEKVDNNGLLDESLFSAQNLKKGDILEKLKQSPLNGYNSFLQGMINREKKASDINDKSSTGKSLSKSIIFKNRGNASLSMSRNRLEEKSSSYNSLIKNISNNKANTSIISNDLIENKNNLNVINLLAKKIDYEGAATKTKPLIKFKKGKK